jgi:hypothetical protein
VESLKISTHGFENTKEINLEEREDYHAKE